MPLHSFKTVTLSRLLDKRLVAFDFIRACARVQIWLKRKQNPDLLELLRLRLK